MQFQKKTISIVLNGKKHEGTASFPAIFKEIIIHYYFFEIIIPYYNNSSLQCNAFLVLPSKQKYPDSNILVGS